ncbi:MAG: bifunctional diaminohydroxyphosphoribosylaminopyrimidine deaminase/5-amino-6-(5-phosphoribosylamino)uracil reductase RibD [Methyloligellaceae bacterium]
MTDYNQNHIDRRYLSMALKLARRGLGNTGPNPSVGVVIVQDKSGRSIPEIVGLGCTQPGGRPHAEIVALTNAGENARGATLYVTLDPCTHQGKTPPCTKAIEQAGIARVVSLGFDPNPRVAEQSQRLIEAAEITFLRMEGSLKEAAEWVVRGHIQAVQNKRPCFQLKLAVGQDRRVPRGTGKPVWVTPQLARSHGHLLRLETDAILVGRRTVHDDDPSLTCRLPGLVDRSPIRVVLDSELRTSENSTLVKTASRHPLWIFCSLTAPAEREKILREEGADIIRVATNKAVKGLDLNDIAGHLLTRNVRRVLVEGGPYVAEAFCKAELADEIFIYQGRQRVGAEGINPFGSGGVAGLVQSSRFKMTERYIGETLLRHFRRVDR